MIRHRIGVSMLVLGLALAGITIVPELVNSSSSSQSVAQWIGAHRSQLPRSLAEFNAVPPRYRVQVARALEPEVLSQLWREQHAELLGRKLTPAQRSLVERMGKLLTPSNYRGASTGEASTMQAQMAGLCREASVVFANSPNRQLLKDLGTPDDHVRLRFWNVGLLRILVADRIRAAVALTAESRCNCDSGTEEGCRCKDRCPFCTDTCQCGLCQPRMMGCGCWGLSSCYEPCGGGAAE